MTKGGKLIDGIFSGETINTPSMLCVSDYLDALDWVAQLGGVQETMARSQRNLEVLERFVASHEWIHFLARESHIRSNTSVCLTLDLSPEQVKAMVKLLESERVALDIASYRDAPAGLRIWCGATVESSDLEKLMPWLEWAFGSVRGG
jgi:phosphoserine aminotransferase